MKKHSSMKCIVPQSSLIGLQSPKGSKMIMQTKKAWIDRPNTNTMADKYIQHLNADKYDRNNGISDKNNADRHQGDKAGDRVSNDKSYAHGATLYTNHQNNPLANPPTINQGPNQSLYQQHGGYHSHTRLPFTLNHFVPMSPVQYGLSGKRSPTASNSTNISSLKYTHNLHHKQPYHLTTLSHHNNPSKNHTHQTNQSNQAHPSYQPQSHQIQPLQNYQSNTLPSSQSSPKYSAYSLMIAMGINAQNGPVSGSNNSNNNSHTSGQSISLTKKGKQNKYASFEPTKKDDQTNLSIKIESQTNLSNTSQIIQSSAKNTDTEQKLYSNLSQKTLPSTTTTLPSADDLTKHEVKEDRKSQGGQTGKVSTIINNDVSKTNYQTYLINHIHTDTKNSSSVNSTTITTLPTPLNTPITQKNSLAQPAHSLTKMKVTLNESKILTAEQINTKKHNKTQVETVDESPTSKASKNTQFKRKQKMKKTKTIKEPTIVPNPTDDIEAENNATPQPVAQNKAEPALADFVTSFKCPQTQPRTLAQCSSEQHLNKVYSKAACVQPYYVQTIINAYDAPKPTTFDLLCINHFKTSYDFLSYVKNANLLPPSEFNSRSLAPSRRPTIVFDLDETLIHCTQSTKQPPTVSLPITFPNNTVITAHINVRPYAKECLNQLSQYFQLIVFTASHQCYANVIVDYLDPEKKLFAHRFFRDSCHRTQEGFYVKDLRVVDRDPKAMLLVDNVSCQRGFALGGQLTLQLL